MCLLLWSAAPPVAGEWSGAELCAAGLCAAARGGVLLASGAGGQYCGGVQGKQGVRCGH